MFDAYFHKSLFYSTQISTETDPYEMDTIYDEAAVDMDDMESDNEPEFQSPITLTEKVTKKG